MNQLPSVHLSEATSSVCSSVSGQNNRSSSFSSYLSRSLESSSDMTPQIQSTSRGSWPTTDLGPEAEPLEALQHVLGLEEVHSMIGAGTFSYVFNCTLRGQRVRVAAKLLKHGGGKEDFAEARLMATLRHPNLVRMLQFHFEPVPCLILELCEGGNLQEFLHGASSCVATALKVKQRAKMMLDVFRAVEYLHSQETIHRDIKSGNCFLTAPVCDPDAPVPPVKLGDLGLARGVEAAMTRFVGTVVYMAPDLITTAKYGKPVDIYSCCILLHEAVSVQMPFAFMGRTSQPALIMRIVSGLRPHLSSLPNDDSSDKLGQLMEKGWGADPTSRVNATQLTAHLEEIIGESAQEV